MKTRPILFSHPLPAAIMQSRKTQTRRIIKDLPTDTEEVFYWAPDGGVSRDGWAEPGCYFRTPRGLNSISCPYGQPGDRLWVKETYFLYGHWIKNGTTKKGKQKWKFVPNPHQKPRYVSDPPKVLQTSKNSVGWFKRPSIFMRRKDSRITLEITNVKVERLRYISEEDAQAEGVEVPAMTCCIGNPKKETINKLREIGRNLAFSQLWNSINGPGSWEANPWVWVIEFRKIPLPGNN